MPDREAVSRVAKILARVTSSDPAEAAAALRGAYKRMVRDGVTLPDLLTLPQTEIYQETLVKLIDLILAAERELSPSAKREAYAEYMRRIVAKFPGDDPGGQGSGSPGAARAEEREKEARAYKKRWRAHEAGQGRGAASSPASSTRSDEKPFSRTNSKTAEWFSRVRTFRVWQRHFSISPAVLLSGMQGLFGGGSITWHALHNPGRAARLFGVSMLYGVAFSGVMLSVAAFLHALTGTGPLWDVKLKNAFAFLAALGFLFKARVLFLAGWFR